ncbi:MAG: suppressor of fused domain protein [Brumimicrobium sp.]
MSELKKALQKRLGEHRVHSLETKTSDYIDLLLLDIETKIPIKVLITDGLSKYEMPVPERYKERVFNEIFFALPSYWELDEVDNPNMQWPLKQIQKLAEHVVEKETWYGPGHTFTNGNPAESFSENMKQNHLLLSTPISLEEILQPIEIEGKTVYFLAIIPLFEEEFDRKMSKGYFKFIRQFRARNGDEILDDFRSSIFKSRWRIFG